MSRVYHLAGDFYIYFLMNYHLREKNSKKMFLILYRKKNNNIYKSSTGLCNVCVVHYFHPRCALLFFLSTFWSVTLSNIEQHPLSVTLKNYKLALLVGKKKEKPKMLIIFVCVF